MNPRYSRTYCITNFKLLRTELQTYSNPDLSAKVNFEPFWKSWTSNLFAQIQAQTKAQIQKNLLNPGQVFLPKLKYEPTWWPPKFWTLNPQTHYVHFSQFYWHFCANFEMHIWSMLQVCIIAIWYQGLILNSGKSYATFGTKIPVFRANSGCFLGTKWQKWWIYKNVTRMMKIAVVIVLKI